MTNLNILENSRALYIKINDEIMPLLDKFELYTIGSQLMRSSLSISLNIREGNSYDDKRKNNQFNIAIGSCEETDECIYLLSLKYPKIDYVYYNDKLSHIKFTLLKIIKQDLAGRRSEVEGRLQ